jgi:hypothetical protein
MKTHILQLEQHDDVVSARDKMKWAKGERILLVWPEGGHVLNRQLDLVLLQRHSRSLGAQLALVTRDPDVTYYAPRLGIPVFKNLRKAQGDAHWRLPRRFRSIKVKSPGEVLGEPEAEVRNLPPADLRQARPAPQTALPSPTTRLAFFTLGVLAFLSISALLFPSAEVTLTPQSLLQETTVDVTASPDASGFTLSGVVPANTIEVIVEGRDRLPVSGSVQLPLDPARGSVEFTNLTDQPVEIPQGTLVSSQDPALEFSVTQAGQVPAGSGQTETLPVHALSPGSQGNLPAGSLVVLEGLLGTRLSATNPAPTRGGTDRQEPLPTSEDRRRLHDQLVASLEETALNELEAGLGPGDLLIPGSLQLVGSLEEAFQPAEAQPADHLELNLRLEFQGQVVSAQDLRALAKAVLDAELPDGYLPDEASLQVEHHTPPQRAADGTARWQLSASRQIQARLPEPQVVRLSLGLPPEQAIARLQAALPLAGEAQITLLPAWWPRLPFLPFRIAVKQIDG